MTTWANHHISSLHDVCSGVRPFPGKLRLVDILGRMGSRIGDGHASLSLWPGTQFQVDLHDRIQRQMWVGCYEPHVRKCLEALLREGDVFLDIGAHIGYHTAIAARLVGPQGNIFAFEADPVVYQTLARNVAPLPWVRAFHYAVWKESGTLDFERSPSEGESGWGTLTSVRDFGKGAHVKVQAVSLDGWTHETQLKSLRLIKIDAEGSELAVLRGGRRVLGSFRPILLLEINDVTLRQGRASAELLLSDLRGCEYRVYELQNRTLRPRNSFKESEFADCLCVPEESAVQLLEMLEAHGIHTAPRSTAGL